MLRAQLRPGRQSSNTTVVVHQSAAISHFPAHRRAELLDNLPLQLTRFIGRKAELAHVRHLLRDERLLTLTGPGGIGKTRLAIETAALAEPRLVPHALAEQLCLRAGQGTIEHVLIEYLRPRRLLLVLDNCE